MSSVDCTNAHINTLLDDIKLHISIEVFKKHLQKCSRQKLESWTDENDLDLLHHAILENNFVVVGTLFALGYFKPPHEVSASWTYVHLAAVLGERTIVSMLLQERPYDNKNIVLDWEIFHKVIAPKLDVTQVTTSIVPTEERERKFAFLPLGLAARYGHVQSVRTILDFHIFRSQQSQGTSRRSSLVKQGHMNMACMLDSPFALRLLLTASPDPDDAKNALDISLKTAKPECVDALLRFGIDTKCLFGGMNLFHVLFAYSKSFEESWFESFVTVTSVLLRHRHDVNACRPSRTYPLYSLLRCTRMPNIEKSAPYVIAALLLLLQAGADPNFDEVFVEKAVRDKEHNTAFGRKPYPSALHCLIDASVNYVEEVSDAEHITKYIYKCSELLLRHGADASYIGSYSDSEAKERRGNALHALCESVPHIGRADNSLLLLLLRHGADPDACVDGRYPLISYIDTVCPVPDLEDNQTAIVCCAGAKNRNAERQVSPARRNTAQAASSSANHGHVSHTLDEVISSDFATDVRRMCRMAGFMSHREQQDCAEILHNRLSSHRSSDPNATVALRLALRELEKYTLQVPSLRRCCSLVVWRQCRRHVGNVYKLPAPMPLINVVMDHL